MCVCVCVYIKIWSTSKDNKSFYTQELKFYAYMSLTYSYAW